MSGHQIRPEAVLASMEPTEPDSPWWWLSFCDADRPEGSQFLGACIVQAANQCAAIPSAWEHGCNAGGEVALMGPIPHGFQPPPEWLNILLTREQCEELETVMGSRS